MAHAIWTTEHVDFLASLHQQNLTQREMSVLMSKHFKMRVTVPHVTRLLSKMRLRGHEIFRDIPYHQNAARRQSD